MNTPKPTEEQAVIVDACLAGGDLVIEAAAGSGKTTTLKMVATGTDRRGLYLAYNKAIKEDAVKSFPGSVRCVTSHGLAFGPAATPYKHRIGGPRIPAQQAANILGVVGPTRLHKDLAPLAPAQLTRIATATVARFCYSADDEITARNVPLINGLEEREIRLELAAAVVPIAVKVWEDICNPKGQLRFEHDHYLKMFQLGRPVLDVDYLLVDEAQDLNPVVQAIVSYQKNAQVILVGDRHQAIYGWRGAVDAMSTFGGDRLQLTQSFRFGHAIADEANKWLELLRADLRVRGFDRVHSTVGPHAEPDATLCRSNSAAIGAVISALDKGRRVALVGGGADIARLARAARDLQGGRPCDHPELLAFSSWGEVQDYVQQDSAGSDLKVLVDLIDKHGVDAILNLTNRLTSDESRADLIVSTAHKAKGREWDTVKIATDFREPLLDKKTGKPGAVGREDAMLAYVAVTRAKNHLDNDGLAWIDKYVTGGWSRDRLLDLDDEAGILEPSAAAPVAVNTTAPVISTQCMRCGSSRCICDPATAKAWSQRTGLPVGASAAYAHNRAQGRDKVESLARALVGIPDGV